MRTGITIAIEKIHLSVKQDMSTTTDWNNIASKNLLIKILLLLSTIYNGSANRKLKLQGKNVKDSNYKNIIKTQFVTMLAKSGQYFHSTSILVTVVKENTKSKPYNG